MLERDRLRLYFAYPSHDPSDNLRATFSLSACVLRNVSGLSGISGDLQNRCVHLLHGGGRLTHAPGLFFGPAVGLFDLRRKLFRCR